MSAFHAEEDPNDQFVYDRTESVLHLSLDAPGGTSLSPYDSPVAVGVLLERYSWQIWRQRSTGAEEYREPGTVPESGATVTLTRSPEMGTLAESTLITGSDGRAWTTFSPDGTTSNISIDATSADSTASFSFSITSTPGFEESWYLSHTEATLVAEITSVLSTQDVPSGENRDLSLSVRYETWDVMASNLGNTRTENFTSAPAEGASVTWSLESGDGTVSGYGTTDSGGLAQGSFTMGSGESIIRAEIAYATGQATTAPMRQP